MTETAIKPLSYFFDEILDNAAENVEIGNIERDEDGWDYDYRSNSIYFENDSYIIEGSFMAVGLWSESGDGYWTPRESDVSRVKVQVEELTAFGFNPETQDYDIEVEKEILKSLGNYLEKNLPGVIAA